MKTELQKNAVKTARNAARSIAMSGAILALALTGMQANAEITEDCILEGTVDMRKAEELGQSVYVNFRNARRGSEAGCSLNRRSKSRRVQFIRSPDASDIENANHGSKVRYRYIERDNQAGNWELIEVRGS
jgi:hypothetical protein